MRADMTAEKKKRIPKPQSTPAIEKIIGVIPWLNYNPKIWNNKEFLSLFRENVMKTFFSLNDTKKAIEQVTEYLKAQTSLDALRNTHFLARLMIHDLANSVNDQQYEWQIEASEIVQSMKIILMLNPPRIEVKENIDNGFSIPKVFEQMMVKAIVDSFGASGKAYIGSCPKCKKIFAKEQQNKFFCCKLCADLFSQAKKRKEALDD
jgi:hypothetical protein